MRRAGTAGIALLAVALVAVIAVGGWALYWWVFRQSTVNEAHVRRSTFEYQQTYRDEITRKIADVRAIDVQLSEPDTNKAAVRAQRVAIVNIICGDADKIVGDPLPADQQSFIHNECP